MFFLASYLDAWLSDRALLFAERKMHERPEFEQAVERNLILRTVNRFNKWQRKR